MCKGLMLDLISCEKNINSLRKSVSVSYEKKIPDIELALSKNVFDAFVKKTNLCKVVKYGNYFVVKNPLSCKFAHNLIRIIAYIAGITSSYNITTPAFNFEGMVVKAEIKPFLNRITGQRCDFYVEVYTMQEVK